MECLKFWVSLHSSCHITGVTTIIFFFCRGKSDWAVVFEDSSVSICQWFGIVDTEVGVSTGQSTFFSIMFKMCFTGISMHGNTAPSNL